MAWDFFLKANRTIKKPITALGLINIISMFEITKAY